MSASSSSDSIPPPLSQGWGYGVTVGFGLAFATGMHFVSRLLKKHTGEDNSHFETYATAGRTVGVGLTCVAVISSWAWSTALLSSSVVANSYGVAGPYAFAAGCLVQVGTYVIQIRKCYVLTMSWPSRLLSNRSRASLS